MQTFTCDAKNECGYSKMSCLEGSCKIECTGETSCHDATIICPPEGDCVIVCSGRKSCENVSMQCGRGYCQVICLGDASACEDMQDVDCSNAGTCLVTCEASMNAPPNAVACSGRQSDCPCSDDTCF